MNTTLMEINSQANATAEMEAQYSLQTHGSLRQPPLIPIAGPEFIVIHFSGWGYILPVSCV